MTSALLLLLIAVCGALAAPGAPSLHFTASDSSYRIRYSFVTTQPAAVALQRLYAFDDYCEYVRGFQTVGLVTSQDSSYIVENRLTIPFYSMTLRLRRSLDLPRQHVD